jgi:hypothetical protein
MIIGKLIISTVLIRCGGAPSGAAAYTVIGGMGISTPIVVSTGVRFNMEMSLKIFILCACDRRHHVRFHGK